MKVHRQPSRWQKVIQKIAVTKGGEYFSRPLHHLDKPILWLTNNQKSLTSILSGLPVVVLTSIGAKSGKTSTVTLLRLLDGEDVIVIASNWGQSCHPGWYYNLRANPEAQLSSRGHTGTFTAREATDVERQKYWNESVAMFAGYAKYKKRAKGRRNQFLSCHRKSPGLNAQKGDKMGAERFWAALTRMHLKRRPATQ